MKSASWNASARGTCCAQRMCKIKKRQGSTNLRPLYSGDTWVLDWGSMPILGLTIRAVIGVLMVPITFIFRSVPQNNTPLITSPCLAYSLVSHCQGNGQIGQKRN